MIKILASLFLLIPIAASGQQLSHPVMASRDDLFHLPRPLLTAPDTVNILAVMVQFAVDDDEATTGNGQFDLSSTTDPVIDAPPHDGAFFTNHMTFLGNYFGKASDGKQVLATTLVDTIFTLSAVMGDYSPRRGENNDRLAQLARDTWELVGSSGKVADFGAYDCFVIFHAGTGRDIDLVSIFGYDPTPRDIPSLFLGPSAFRLAFGEEYPGIVVNGGQDTIRNSALLPETESRLIPTLTGDFLLELSFNGLLCASVASYLGLPDLFNTATGGPAIGRFGLMDGQAIFSFFGTFPPEPSAWEKYSLGWIDPLVIGAGEQTLSLPAAGAAAPDSVYRFPVSASEYFLAENRQRDPGGDGQTVTYVFNGSVVTRTFAEDTTGFNAFDISELAGVVTDVQDLDWSLPGGIDIDGNRLNGGGLIWHIDESIIQREIGTNTINADPLHRGVDLEEADGSQDIGQDYGFLSPGSGSEEGTAIDFWFLGNPSPIFENLFSGSTFPSSASNTGALSLISISEFSASGSRMTCKVMIGDDQVSPMAGFPRSTGEYPVDRTVTIAPVAAGGIPSVLLGTTGSGIPTFGLEGDSTVALPGSGKVFAWTTDGGAAMAGGFSDGRIVDGFGLTEPVPLESYAVSDLNGDQIPDVLVTQAGPAGQSILRAFSPVDANGDSLADPLFTVTLPHRVTAPPVIADSMIAVGTDGGKLLFVTHDGVLLDSVDVLPPGVHSVTGISVLAQPATFLAAGSEGTIAVYTRTPDNASVESGIGGIVLGSPLAGPPVAGTFGSNGQTTLVAAATIDGNLSLMSTQGSLATLPGFPVVTGLPCSAPPALADIDGDGRRDVVLFAGNRIFVYNMAGALVDNFPVTLSSFITSAPIVADVDGDLDPDIIAVTEDGQVVAADRSGRPVPGFPLQAGIGNHSAAVITISGASLSTYDVGLIVSADGDGSASGWTIGRIPVNGAEGFLPWPQYQRDAAKTGLVTGMLSGSPVSSSFFPRERVYNWPNPVYENTTWIRFFVSENARVNVRVFDLAGDLVSEFSADATGGVDNEIAWDVSDVQSGIYFARVEANGSSGSGNAVIKVAVVR